MKIQPIDANQRQTSFQAMRLPKLKIKPRAGKQLTYEQERDRNYLQAIMVGLTFVAAAFTKYFIDTANKLQKNTAPTEIISQKPSTEKQDTVQWK